MAGANRDRRGGGALTPAPLTVGSRVRLRQPKLPEGTWDVTVWDAPRHFEWTQKSGGVTNVAGHRVEALDDGRARLTLTLEMHGLLVPILGRFYKDLTNRYMTLEAAGMKRAAESRSPQEAGAAATATRLSAAIRAGTRRHHANIRVSAPMPSPRSRRFPPA